MSANSLRGGKHIYKPRVLSGNWAEERWTPKVQEEMTMAKVYALPESSFSTWTTTSSAHGQWTQGEVEKRLAEIKVENYLKYRDNDPNETYQSTSRRSFLDKSKEGREVNFPEKVAAANATNSPEDVAARAAEEAKRREEDPVAAAGPEGSPERNIAANPKYGPGWVEEYRKEWTAQNPKSDMCMFDRETFGDWHQMAVKKSRADL